MWSSRPLLSLSQTAGAGRLLAWTQGSKGPVEGHMPLVRFQRPQPIRGEQEEQPWDSDSGALRAGWAILPGMVLPSCALAPDCRLVCMIKYAGVHVCPPVEHFLHTRRSPRHGAVPPNETNRNACP